MRTRYNRKQSPKVIGGQVLRKNNHAKTARQGYVVDRIRPGKGYRHVLRKKDIHDFVELIPDWTDICEGIESIILDSGDDWADGYYQHRDNDDTGIIWVTAWNEELWRKLSDDYFQEHRRLIDKLEVVNDKVIEEDEETKEEIVSWQCYFSESQAKAFTLMHVFLHELGHHVDKMRSRNKKACNGGESFAERYANRRFAEIWPRYVERFGELY
ncbi:MAG: hypothetical protein OQK04_03875 [Kangiellaceae bacterium]|nr:hypothetical protein [Kangiellaceae bacterium]MCW8997832.1 hypothetical protein [Kangiellaceae bacterium]